MKGVSPTQNAAMQAVDTPQTTGGAGSGGYLAEEKDTKVSAKEAKFGEVWNQIQSKYGAKPEKAREIKKTLGKDDFLRIMITQMKNQDPTTPFKAEQFATQLAQFTSVEQMQNMNQSLGKMANQNAPLERLAMTNMIGKTITIDRERFPHTEGQNDSLAFALTKDAKETKILIVSESGETVMEKDMGPLKKGDNTLTWDGLKTNTLPSKTGTYMFRVESKDDHGQIIPITSKGQARVVGVSFEGAEAILLVGDPNAPEKVTMKNVVRIDGDSNLIPGAKPLSEANPQSLLQTPLSGQKNNMIQFQKGVGSGNADPTAAMPPDAQKVMAQYQAQMAAQKNQNVASAAPAAQQMAPRAAQSAPQNNSENEKGFPNGLSENNDKINNGAAEKQQ